jgi:arylsulfatase A-like enzyme
VNAIDRAVRVAVAQWPPLALAWSIHGILVLYLFLQYAPRGLTMGARLVLAGGLLCLILLEMSLLLLIGLGVELAFLWLPKKLPVDALKGAGVAGAIGLLTASTVKFSATSVHLKSSDLRLAAIGLPRVLSEATALEALARYSVPIGALLLFAGLWAGLDRFRRREPRAGVVRPLALPAAAALLLALLWTSSAPLRLFAGAFVPEIAWVGAAAAHPPYAHDADLQEDSRWGTPILPYDPGRPGRPQNVVLILLESVPWSRTSFGGGPPGVTPTLEALAEESVLFSRAYAPSTHCDDAQLALLSSLHPRRYERHEDYFPIEYPRTLIWDALAAAGYHATMFSSQDERRGNKISFLDTPGLEVLRHALDWPRAAQRGNGGDGRVYEETAIATWESWRSGRRREPFFTYFNFQASHFPYEVPPDEARPFVPFELDFPATFLGYPRDRVPLMLHRFHNALAYEDRMVARVVAGLKARGEWQRTVLVVVSDHGEAFYEHGSPTHGGALFEEQVRSLWMMRVPGESARTVTEPVSLLDVAPTLLRVLGLPPHGNFQGRGDVLEPGYEAAGRPFPFTIQARTLEDGLLLDDWKYVVNWDRRDRRLFDLRADPGETDNLVEEESDRGRALDRRLADLVRRQLAYYGEKGWLQGRYAPALR